MTAELPLRVTVLDTWDEIACSVSASTTVGTVKANAIREGRLRGSADEYLIKFRGAACDDQATLEQIGAVPNAPLILLRRRRRPFR